MRVDQRRQRMWLGAAGMFFLSLLVVLADRAGQLTAARPLLHDLLSPSRLVLLAIAPPKATVSFPVSSNAISEHDQETARQERLLRQLMIENARLRRDLQRERSVLTIMETIEPLSSLVQFELVRASVISSRGMPGSLRDLIVDAGKSSGVTRSELVVDGDGILLDAGVEQHVAAGDRVLTGAIVVGRVDKAAHWVSLVQPVTAAGFKAHVVLLRHTPDGLHAGSTGLLEGTGESECRLAGIPHTEAVSVGDEVVSADIEGVRGPQLYFGQVTRAEFLAGGQWDIRVRPAASIYDLETVGILQLNLLAREKISRDDAGRRHE